MRHTIQEGNSSPVFLSSELSISKLWKMFNESKPESEQITECLFRKVFCNHFNICFSTPAVDEYSICIELKKKLSIEKDEAQRAEFKFRIQLHKINTVFFNIWERETTSLPPPPPLPLILPLWNLILPKVTPNSLLLKAVILLQSLCSGRIFKWFLKSGKHFNLFLDRRSG